MSDAREGATTGGARRSLNLRVLLAVTAGGIVGIGAATPLTLSLYGG